MVKSGKMSAIYDYGQRQKDEGIKEGKEETFKKMAKYMIKKGESNEEIQKETQLSIEEIEKLREKN